jgi:hypothetical protein
MPKPPKTPRPTKPPMLPPRENDQLNLTIGLIHEKLIGRVVMEWSRIEEVMGEFIWFLLKLEVDYGRVVTTRLDATIKIKMLRELGELRLRETHFHELSQILDHIDILRDDRNFIVHGIWGRNLQSIPIALSLRPKPLAPGLIVSEEFSGKRMRDIVHGIETARLQLMTLMKELSALPEKSDPRHHED